MDSTLTATGPDPHTRDVTYDDDGIPYHVCGAASIELDEPFGWLHCPVCDCAVCWECGQMALPVLVHSRAGVATRHPPHHLR